MQLCGRKLCSLLCEATLCCPICKTLRVIIYFSSNALWVRFERHTFSLEYVLNTSQNYTMLRGYGGINSKTSHVPP